MKENIGGIDKLIRIAAVAGVVLINVMLSIPPILALVLGIVGIVLLFSIVSGVCPVYRRFGISTKRR